MQKILKHHDSQLECTSGAGSSSAPRVAEGLELEERPARVADTSRAQRIVGCKVA